MLFRDDDISVHTPLSEFREVHEMFIEADKTHTIGIVVKDIWMNLSLWNYLVTAPNLEWALHGWEHINYAGVTYQDDCNLVKALDILTTRHAPGAKGIKTCQACVPAEPNRIHYFFPPFNRVGNQTRDFCRNHNLTINNVYGENADTFAFHYWEIICYPSVKARLRGLLCAS